MSEQTQTSQEVGFVTKAKNYLLSLKGFPSVRVNDVLRSDDGHRAIVTALEDDEVTALLLDRGEVKTGDRFFLSPQGLMIPVGDHVLGHIVSPLGDILDDHVDVPRESASTFRMDVKAPGVDSRSSVTDQFITGISFIDTLIPLAKGQRQLVFGPIRSGKSTVLQNIIRNQAGKGVICIYAAVGKPLTFIRELADKLMTDDVRGYLTIVSALSDQPSSLISVAPASAFLLAEYFRDQGRDVLLVIDDMAAHAKYLREIALLQGRVPGRESYPGDIFYQHAHLIERAGSFNDRVGGGTITFLPVLETDIESFTNLIPTNLMASTDGHYFFSADRRSEGYYPSLNEERSVTRVGRQTQNSIQKELSSRIVRQLVLFHKQEEFAGFGTKLGDKSKLILKRGAILTEMLRQEPMENIPPEVQIPMLSLAFTDFAATQKVSLIKRKRQQIVEVIRDNDSFAEIRTNSVESDITLDELIKKIDALADALRESLS